MGPTGGELLVFDVLSSLNVVPKLSCEIFVIEDGLGSDEDGERFVEELLDSGKGRSGASSSWLEHHQ
jgi:hypothetical protein